VINTDWHLAASEGLMMPDKAAVVGMSRVNPLPTTNIHRKRLHAETVKPPKSFAPMVQKVAEIVPNKPISKLKPLQPRPPLG
jgi:hypothetical protein